MKTKKAGSGLADFFTKPKAFLTGAVIGLVVATIVVTRFFSPTKEVVHEVETLSPSVVFERVIAQNELVCASQNYAIVDKATDTARLFDLIDLPWTTNSFWYRYCGTIKAGVNLQTAEFSQDENDANKLTVTLDQPYVISNTPDMGKSGVLEEHNNILNPIEVKDVDAFQRQCVERSEQEVFSLDELVEAFDIAGISKSPAIFDIEKLTYFNATYLRALAPEEFAKVAEPYIRQSVKNPAIDTAAIAALLQARCEKLTDIPEKVDFFDQLPDYDVEFFTNKKSKTNPEVCKAMLEAAIPMLENLPAWTDEAIHDGLIALAEQLGVKNATLMWPVRIAAAGKLVTPGGAVEICRILGRDETLRRLRAGLEKLA